MRIIVASCAAALSILLGGGALAFDAASPDSPGDAAARSAKSIECSQKADAQNLHGKPRKQFMRECKHAK